MANLTFNGDEYGELDLGFTIHLDKIQDWLMEPDERPTTWPTLVRIRREKSHCRRRAE